MPRLAEIWHHPQQSFAFQFDGVLPLGITYVVSGNTEKAEHGGSFDCTTGNSIYESRKEFIAIYPWHFLLAPFVCLLQFCKAGLYEGLLPFMRDRAPVSQTQEVEQRRVCRHKTNADS
jgi:hypothetical protein